jgi:hypothetical protein
MWGKVVKGIPIDTYWFLTPMYYQKGIEPKTLPSFSFLCINFVWYQIKYGVRIEDRAPYPISPHIRT